MKLIVRLVIIGVSALAVVTQGSDRYVVVGGTGSGASWADATSNLFDAVAGSTAGCTVYVSNGVYTLTNQVTVTNFTIRSYNNGAIDRDGTIIDGGYYAGRDITNRCFFLNHAGAVVDGFTITNGYANGGAGAATVAGNGGGVNMAAGTLRNCLVTGNTANNGTTGGGGVYATGAGSVITNCDVIANTCMNGGAPSTCGGGGVKLSSSASLVNSPV